MYGRSGLKNGLIWDEDSCEEAATGSGPEYGRRREPTHDRLIGGSDLGDALDNGQVLVNVAAKPIKR